MQFHARVVGLSAALFRLNLRLRLGSTAGVTPAHRAFYRICFGIAAVAWLAARSLGAGFAPSPVQPPPVPREFRGVWIASVKNIDWPSKPGLGAALQKAELIAILDRCVQLRLNAVFLQVRPACDALYESKLEPWSEYLTGTMGRSPGYDPLTFAVEEAHRRGLELHAWMNPFRARHASSTAAFALNHISQTRPALVKNYGKSLWLDPGEREVQEHSLRVVRDVVTRYDVDGLHFDDYFYPYDEKDRQGKVLPFPDSTSWSRYQSAGGQLTREDWRRENVNTFIRRARDTIHGQKSWVRFGVSPFGIWRPGFPAGVKGLDAYDKLFADSRRWLAEGWVDYLVPQLYWSASAPQQSFPALLRWWTERNPRGRQVWAGLSHRHSADEIVRQIRLARQQPGAGGHVHWSMKSLLPNSKGTTDALVREVYSEPALAPAWPWLDASPPPAPGVNLTTDAVSAAFGKRKSSRPGRTVVPSPRAK
jgi:uncharacterized lipoprotein YddW (UPF0748 family)